MSRVLLSDALHLAAALVRLPPARRANELQGWIVQAHAAAKYMRRFGRPHPGWGDGSLTSRALQAGAREDNGQRREGPDFFRALALVADCLGRAASPRR